MNSIFFLEYQDIIHKELQELKQEIIGPIEENLLEDEVSRNTLTSSTTTEYSTGIYNNPLW